MKDLTKNNIFFLLSICCLLIGSIAANAQSILIKGKVMDSHTEEAIPFANVFLKGTTVGVSTDIDGNYELQTERLVDTLGVSAIGYKAESKIIPEGSEVKVYFKLDRSVVKLNEVVVKAGENPAHPIIRNIIANKKENNAEERLANFKHEVYNKLELDMSDISEDFMNKRLFKPFSFIFENIDSVSEEKPFLPVFITETLSDFYFKQDPTENKEIIKASKISGIKNESVTQFLGNMYQQVRMYNNWINIMGKNFASPISDNGFNYYEYYLVDSAFIENHWCYQINFKPKRKQENTFNGDFWVNDTTFAIKQASMQLIAKEININFVDKISVYQNFTPVQDSIWMLTKDKLIINFISAEDAPGLIGRKSTHYKDFVIEDPIVLKAFESKEDLVVDEDVMEKTEDFWREARHEELTENEEAIYAMVDTIKNVPIAKTYADIVTFVVTGYKDFGPVEFGPIFSLWSSNPVEGNRFQLGMRTNSKLSERFQVGGYLAYGIKDNRFKYGANGRLLINNKPWQTLEIKYSNDLDLQSESELEFGENNFLAGLYRRNVPQKLTHIRRFSIAYERDWAQGWSSKIQFTDKNISPYFNFYYPDAATSELDSNVHVAEVKLSTRFSYRERFVKGQYSRVSLGSEYPTITLSYTLGLKGLLGSEYNYHKVEMIWDHWFYLNPFGWTEYLIKAGKIFGDLPFLLLHRHPGNETFFYNTYSFNNMNDYEFISDTYASIYVTHHFDGFIFNHIPLLRKLKLRALVGGKFTYGTLSDRNIALNSSAQNFDGNWQIQAPQPYIEGSLGIENIFKLFRVDLVRRFSYLDNPNIPEYGIRAGMELLF